MNKSAFKFLPELPIVIWQTIYRSLLNFFLPPFCIVCETAEIKPGKIICDECWNQLPAIENNAILTDELRAKLSNEVYFSDVISLWEFCSAIQNIIHFLKYRDFWKLGEDIGKVMAQKLSKISLPIENTILIPIPLHKTRIRERGYNQSALLCEAISNETGLVFNDRLIKRTRNTKSQTKLNSAERRKNVHNAFKVVSEEKIKDKIVVLVDDVITTGATMNACARVLMESGADKVLLFSAIRA